MGLKGEINNFDTIINANIMGTFSIALDTGILEFSHSATEKMLLRCERDCDKCKCCISHIDFIKQVHPMDKETVAEALKQIMQGDWNEDDYLPFRLSERAKDFEWLSMKISYVGEESPYSQDSGGRTAQGIISDYSSSMRLQRLGALALEGAAKYTFFYDYKTDMLVLNDEFARDFNVPANPIFDAGKWVSEFLEGEQAEELSFGLVKVKAGESDTLDLRVRIYDGFALKSRWLQVRAKCDRDDRGAPVLLAGSILDISQQVRDQELNSLIIEGSSDCVFVFDLEKDVYEFSTKIYDLLPVKSRKFNNGMEMWLSFIVQQDRHVFEDAMAMIKTKQANNFKAEFRLKGRGGSPFWVACLGKCSFDEQGNPTLVAGSLVNLDEMPGLSKYMDEKVSANRSSALPNRSAFYQEIGQLISSANKDQEQIEEKALGNIFMIDIDGFGSINSLHGLLIGDKMLMEYGSLLSMLLPVDGKLFHFGNNMFVVYIESTEHDKVVKIAEDIRKYSASGLLVDGIHLAMTVSIGVSAIFSTDKVDDTLVNVELALRRAKESRNAVDYFTKEYRDAYIARLNLESCLTDCVADGCRGFEVFYQPLYSVSTNIFIGAEALLRWRNSEGNLVSPGLVIPALENTGLLAEVEAWVFRTASEQCAKWIELTGIKDFAINVNMSPQRATSGGLTKEVQEVLKKFGLGMHNMFLELTEEGILVSSEGNMASLYELRDLGARISLDDFGTGHSSLGRLRHLPVCELKIDRSFVIDIEENETSREFMGALINLSHILNYIVCVEGIETLEQLRIASQLNADLIQGYYFAPPIPAERFEKEIIATNTCKEAFMTRHKQIWG